MIMGQSLVEEIPNFIVTGTNDSEFEIKIERFFGFSSRPRKVILIGLITKGVIFTGDNIEIKFSNEKVIKDKILEIEINNKKISQALKNEDVGIRIKNTTIRNLRKMNKESNVL